MICIFTGILTAGKSRKKTVRTAQAVPAVLRRTRPLRVRPMEEEGESFNLRRQNNTVQSPDGDAYEKLDYKKPYRRKWTSFVRQNESLMKGVLSMSGRKIYSADFKMENIGHE